MRKAFRIDPNNGTVTVVKPLDRETADWHNLTVAAKETSEANLLLWKTCFQAPPAQQQSEPWTLVNDMHHI